jgi:hypothetical protein
LGNASLFFFNKCSKLQQGRSSALEAKTSDSRLLALGCMTFEASLDFHTTAVKHSRALFELCFSNRDPSALLVELITLDPKGTLGNTNLLECQLTVRQGLFEFRKCGLSLLKRFSDCCPVGRGSVEIALGCGNCQVSSVSLIARTSDFAVK